MTAHQSKPPPPPLLKCKMFCTLLTRFYIAQNASFNVAYIQNSKMSGFYSLPFASMAAKTSGISKVNAAAMYEDSFMDVW